MEHSEGFEVHKSVNEKRNLTWIDEIDNFSVDRLMEQMHVGYLARCLYGLVFSSSLVQLVMQFSNVTVNMSWLSTKLSREACKFRL